ncbi:hypothetical protein M0R45_001547 [Rubus argutus]|uniref:Uncharacterized protein n=1 Tax=Rubus argutus TaxID=59490 RepID=A0AAW1VH32_RUBAR
MAQPGGNENNSNQLQVGLGVAPMFKRGAPAVLVYGGRHQVVKSRLEAAINEERSLSARRRWWCNRRPRLQLHRAIGR